MSAVSMNPWLTMWYKPRQTMRYVLDHYPRRLMHTLVIAGAFTHIASSASFYWYSWWATALIWLLLSIITGIVTLYIFGSLIKWTGNWLKGSASLQQVFSAIAWSQVPVLYFFIIELIILGAVGGNGMSLVFTTFRFLFAVWGFVIFLACLQEAQRFTFFKSLINYVMAVVILLVVLVIANLVIAFFAQPGTHDMVQTTQQSG